MFNFQQRKKESLNFFGRSDDSPETAALCLEDVRLIESSIFANIIENGAARRFSAQQISVSETKSVTTKSVTTKATCRRPSPELRIHDGKRKLIISAASYPRPMRLPDEMLESKTPVLLDNDLPDVVRLPTPLNLKDSQPIRRAEKAHKPKSCVFRTKVLPMPPRIHWTESWAIPQNEGLRMLASAFKEDGEAVVIPFRR